MKKWAAVVFVVLAVSSCGSSSPKGSYGSVDAIAAKLRAAGLGCSKYDPNYSYDDDPKPKGSNECVVGNRTVGTVSAAITVYGNAATFDKSGSPDFATSCVLIGDVRYSVIGPNWIIPLREHAKLAGDVAAATGGTAEHTRKC